jgi:hypothetical protein
MGDSENSPDSWPESNAAQLRRRPHRRWWLGVSLLAALTATWLGQRSSTVEVADLVLIPYPSRMGDDQPQSWPQSWIAEITLSSDGYPLLIHLDASGWPDRVFPQSGLTPIAGQSILQLPNPAEGVSWSWPSPVQGRDLVAVATSRASLDVAALVELLHREASRAPSAEEARARVLELLESEVGPVREARIADAPTEPAQNAGQT